MTNKLQHFDDFRLAMSQALGVPDEMKLETFTVRFYRTHHTVTITAKMWDHEQRLMVNQIQRFKMVRKEDP